ncbi:MAG: hypothetical protein EKK65_05915 [Lysobacterales bacterium]|nr:MAG: hypothetical protein EKK65_05915 [Xanthomonadales bacterium]
MKSIHEFVYTAQQHLRARHALRIQRTHLYELLAAAFGYKSYAAFCAESIFIRRPMSPLQASGYMQRIIDRCGEIGHSQEAGIVTAEALCSMIGEHEICASRMCDLIVQLQRLKGREVDLDQFEFDEDESDEDEESEEGDQDAISGFDDDLDIWIENLNPGLLTSSLDQAAARGNPLAHYLLAIVHDPDGGEELQPGADYWYRQAQAGRVLSGFQKQFADEYEKALLNRALYEKHLREAARLGQPDALLELAEKTGDPAFFEQNCGVVHTSPARVAEIAEEMGRVGDARSWRIRAANSGDLDVMRYLLERHSEHDLQQCWTWVYLARLMGVDFTEDDFYAIHEDGSDYDDDVGGPMFVDGREGINLLPVGSEQDQQARKVAAELFEAIRRVDP